MTLQLLRTILLTFIILVLSLGVVEYFMQQRHAQTLTAELHAIQTLEAIDHATILLYQQRVQLAESVYMPLDTALFRERVMAFQRIIGAPDLLVEQESQAIQSEILSRYQRFMEQALRLGPSPSPAQVREVVVAADIVVQLLEQLRQRHTANLGAIFATNREQRATSTTTSVIFSLVTIALAIAGFLLIARYTRQQAQIAALQATDQLRNEFVSFAAHELRNPASAIKTGASLLREPDLAPEIRAPVVESINRSADALVRLIMTLLAMGRLEEGRLHLQRKPIMLSALFDDLLGELEPYHPGIANRTLRSLPMVQMCVDAEYLKLAFSNILDNAIKYAPPRSPITVSGDIQPETVTVHIHNEGEGIAPKVLPHLFEKYETSGVAPYSERRGVGLGLYMTRLLIEAHGGSITATSIPGEGATISFTLPRVSSCASEELL